MKKLFPGEQSLFSPEETLVYGTDAGRRFAAPGAVVRPDDPAQVAELLKWAQDNGVPVYPRARGTNVVGGTVPVLGGVVVSTLNLNRILDVDKRDFAAVAQPGVVTADLQKAVRAKGMLYPPDPASAAISTVGGNVSTNAGGLRAVKYGVTRDYVLGLAVVLPGGEIIRTGGRFHKNVVGLDLTRLITGSAGTLGFITEITVKLLPLPEASASVLAGFANTESALAAAADVLARGVLPVAMEFMDRTTMRALADTGQSPFPPDLDAALLLMADGNKAGVEADVARISEAMEQAGCSHLSTGTGAEQEKLWDVRRMINPAAFNIRQGKMADDIAVPRSRLAEAVAGVRRLEEECGLPILCFGHLGDGNLHVNVMHDPLSRDETERAKATRKRMLEMTLALDGSVSGEHGTGLVKEWSVPRQLGSRQMALMRGIKRTFDPKNIMNPGKNLY